MQQHIGPENICKTGKLLACNITVAVHLIYALCLCDSGYSNHLLAKLVLRDLFSAETKFTKIKYSEESMSLGVSNCDNIKCCVLTLKTCVVANSGAKEI